MALLTLPLVAAVVLLELALGGAFMVWYLDRRKEAPAGFLRLTAAVDIGVIGFALAIVPAFPRGADAARFGFDTGRVAALGQGITIIAILLAVQLVTTLLPWDGARALSGAVTLAVGMLALFAGAIARPTTTTDDFLGIILGFLGLVAGALALGGANGAMLLGHWYLVTPKLPTGPLQRAALLVAFAIALQLGLVLVAILRGEVGQALNELPAIAIGIRVGVGLLMAGAIALAAWWTARMNTQASTGLLYVGLGTVLAGEISARVIFFLTGAAV